MTLPIIRPLTLAEVEMLVDWARVEGWNPGLTDAPALYTADPDGFLGCFVDGTMAAGISAVRYGTDFGFIGLYISHPDVRGKGYGRKVWDAGMAHLHGRTIGLDGVPEQQANYRSMGFMPSYETFRWSGTLQGAPHADVSPVDIDHLPAIIDYDHASFPAERTAFLKQWLNKPRIAKAIIRNGIVCGYAVIRQCHDGQKIGPLFANDVAEARILLAACATEARGETIHIDVPAFQQGFSSWLADQGFSQGFTTARMYRGKPRAIDRSRVFAITTLELG